MAHVHAEIIIKAPIEICFDLARDVDLHSKTVWKHTNERAIAGVVSGKIEGNQEVTFEARHFGIKQKLRSKVVEYSRPYLFVDHMQRGAFKYMKHTHMFEKTGEGTLMKDILNFSSPFGIIGTLLDQIVLEKYMKKFIEYRQHRLKEIAEERYKRIL